MKKIGKWIENSNIKSQTQRFFDYWISSSTTSLVSQQCSSGGVTKDTHTHYDSTSRRCSNDVGKQEHASVSVHGPSSYQYTTTTTEIRYGLRICAKQDVTDVASYAKLCPEGWWTFFGSGDELSHEIRSWQQNYWKPSESGDHVRK